MTELTDLYARDYEDSILQEVRDNPFFKVGMRVRVYGEFTGVVVSHGRWNRLIMQHQYDVEGDEGGCAFGVFECDLQRITERKLVLVKS